MTAGDKIVRNKNSQKSGEKATGAATDVMNHIWIWNKTSVAALFSLSDCNLWRIVLFCEYDIGGVLAAWSSQPQGFSFSELLFESTTR